MRLRNKKTGEIGELHFEPDKEYHFTVVTEDPADIRIYKILAGLNEEWEDHEDPEVYYYISDFGAIKEGDVGKWPEDEAHRKSIGNYFYSREEAEKAVEKLKAWKRLRDKGFRFEGWEDLQAKMGIDDFMLFARDVIDTDNVIGFRMDDYHDCIKDLNICFGGKDGRD